jgi:phosphoenolpyruvate-protein phosphotransferase (PTS system enzyme I)
VQRLAGIAAADGISFGHAFLLDRRRVNAPKYHIQREEVAGETQRFRRAIEDTNQQLQRIKEKIYWAGGEDHTLILEAHQLILQDENLVEQTIRHVREELINAEWALRRTVSSIKKLFDEVEDDYFRERRSDVDFVADHILVTLMDKQPVLKDPPSEAIVVAHDISPADMIRFSRFGIKAVVTEAGGRNSHTSIIARSLRIPAVVGLADICSLLGNGDSLIVDGFRGDILISPDEDMVRRYQRRQTRRAQRFRRLRRERELAAETQDGLRIRLLANIELSDEIPLALAQGAEGIGLYRTEFLYLGRVELPTEEDHLADALQVLDYCSRLPVTFRTCDLGVDKIPGSEARREVNPALGLRSIRLCLENRPMFKAQLRGLLRAASKGKARIMFPMISGVDEFREAKMVLLECKRELEAEGISIPDIPVGVMMEMPSAAITADLLAEEADFFSIGTNDLTQYLLAIDRTNQEVNHLFRPYHPALLRLVQSIVTAADAANIPLTVCGEMASDPIMTLVLMGLGVRELSMNALAVPVIKRVIRGVTGKIANDLAHRILRLSTSSDVEAEILRTIAEVFPHQTFSVPGLEDEDTQV